MENKKAFSFVELIIVLTIIFLIGTVFIKISSDSKEKTDNAKIVTDLNSISNSLSAYYQKNNNLPLPDGNKNYYKEKWNYSHEKFDDSKNPAFWVYWVVPETELKEFLSEIPRDPRTNQFYSYWRTKDAKDFEVVWIEKKWNDYFSKVVWNYKWDRGLIWLVREYNWPYFIADGSSNLPFNPEKILLTATDLKWNFFEEKDILEIKWQEVFKNGEKIEFEKSEEKFYDLYISDWSIARINFADTKIIFWKDNDIFSYIKWADNKKSKISMFFEAGSALFFASDLNKDSELQAKTQDTVAAVRWTIFSFSSNWEVKVYKWIVEVTKNGKPQEVYETKEEKEELNTPEYTKNITSTKIEEKIIEINKIDEEWKIIKKVIKGSENEENKDIINSYENMSDCPRGNCGYINRESSTNSGTTGGGGRN